MDVSKFSRFLPSIEKPLQRLSFSLRLKWTAAVLLLYFAMAQVPIYGIAKVAAERFTFFEIITGAKFGTLATLGIGPIVTASIILQLLVGSKIINWDLTNHEQKVKFQSLQKMAAILFTVFEAAAYVLFGAVPPADSSAILAFLLILQLSVGGWLIMLMDEIVTKWGFGSGISLFIAGGVSSQIIVRVFNPLVASGGLPVAGETAVGLVPSAISYIGSGQISSAMLALLPIVATVVVFLVVIYAQAIHVEIPLAFGSLRGFGRNWPLKFIYTSNIPVILTAALLANVRMFATMLSQRGITLLGTFNAQNQPTGGLVYYLTAPFTPSIQALMLSVGVFALVGVFVSTQLMKRWVIRTTALSGLLGVAVWWFVPNFAGLSSITLLTPDDILRFLTYTAFMVGGSVMFSLFWVSTAGMDSHAVAKQIESIGMQIPGFRRDPRIIESVLQKYVPVLTVMGGAFVGLLASYADTVNALGTGTGILLTVMIVYQMYEQIAMQNLEDMHPAMRKFFGK